MSLCERCATSRPEQVQQNRENSINQRVGAREQRRGHGEAERRCATSALPSQAKLFDVGLIPSDKGGLFPLTF
jgi:hypothetical protein